MSSFMVFHALKCNDDFNLNILFHEKQQLVQTEIKDHLHIPHACTEVFQFWGEVSQISVCVILTNTQENQISQWMDRTVFLDLILKIKLVF